MHEENCTIEDGKVEEERKREKSKLEEASLCTIYYIHVHGNHETTMCRFASEYEAAENSFMFSIIA